MVNWKDVRVQEALEQINKLRMKQMLWDDISINNLSGSLGISPKKFRKLALFGTKGNLARFGVSLNYRKAGIITAFVGVKLRDMKFLSEFRRRIRDFDFVQNMYVVNASREDAILRIRCNGFETLRTNILKVYNMKDIVQYTNTILSSQTILEEGKIYDEAVQVAENSGMDSKDMMILHELQANAQYPLAHLSRVTGLTEPTIHRRIGNMKKNGIITGYHIIRQWENVDRKFWPISAFCFIHTSSDYNPYDLINLKSVKEGNVHLRFIYILLGYDELLLSFSTTSMNKLRDMIYEELPNKQGVADIRTHIILESLSKDINLNHLS